MFQPHRVRIFAYFTLFLVIGVWFAMGQARAESVYTVADVAVDASATSAAEARSVALDEGHHRAFQRLLRRLVLVEDHVLFPSIEIPAIAALTDGFII